MFLGGKKRRQYRRLQDEDISSDDLAIIGAGFTVLGDFFDLLSLLKLKEEKENGNANGGDTEETLLDDFLLHRSNPEPKKRRK
ncbi:MULTISPECIES: hypothetical protein [Paenibacillus]|uniref:hypothetical protein n=1 Tax=Paenibacillus TaxID=44249 RepID=UPI001E36356B|nr:MULTISPECIES: hypothetical protein [Paenibacillus]MDU4696693.1 hypothetical protein [Paenibacillus sp.]